MLFKELEIARVERAALGLPIRPQGILAIRTCIPVNAEPVQVRDQGRGVRVAAALGVGVFDAQYEAPVRMARQQQVKERGAGIAQMQLPGRARGKTGHAGPLLALR